jgi:dTDP-4-dehydrorhamnose reductase
LAEVAVLGGRGQLGRQFLAVLGRRARGLSRGEADLGDAETIERALRRLRPRVVINAAAYNDVDGAERRRAHALAVNAEGPGQLARLAPKLGFRLVHFSSDYVFGGDGLERPRRESDAPAPVNFYGYTKLLGEEAVLGAGGGALVVRVAHLYGGESLAPGRASLVERFLARARAGQALEITRGQYLNPTSVRDLTPAVLALVRRGAGGLYHLSGAGACPAEEFAREACRLAGLKAEVRWVRRDARPARRPRYTPLENDRWRREGLPPMPDWRSSLAEYVLSGQNLPTRD